MLEHQFIAENDYNTSGNQGLQLLKEKPYKPVIYTSYKLVNQLSDE